MIIASTGEVCFETGLCVAPHQPFQSILADAKWKNQSTVSLRKLPLEGWTQYVLGIHKSDHGDFEVELATGPELRVEGVFLSHHHSFYDPSTPEDAERRTFHEGVIAADLHGQREFSWGHIFCRVDTKANRDWLVLIYNPFSNVPLHAREVYRQLFEHEIPSLD